MDEKAWGIDLSVGSILALSSALVAGMMASGVGLLAGLVMGIINGIIITKGKVAPFIPLFAGCKTPTSKLRGFREV